MNLRRTSYIFLTLLLFCAVPCFAQDSWENYYRGGLRALQRGDLGAAELLLKSARLKAELEAEKGNADAPAMIVESYSGIAMVLRQEGRPAEAEQTLREQLDLLKSFHRGDDDPQTSMTLHNLGLMLWDQEKFAEAENVLKRAVELRKKYDEEPKRNLAITLLSLGAVYDREKKLEDAEASLLQAREILSKIPADRQTPEDMAAAMRSDHNLAMLFVAHKKYDTAEQYFKKAIQTMEQLYGPESNGLVLYLSNYARLLKTLKRDAEARELLERVEKLKQEKSRYEVPKRINP
ncbi:MAG TPA: tetratricopeptide repeat protein [Pyrinomonadaceae bacterium]|nr:tetratricopeptide repeat protein [Pyrinomonadaceae bacterium]